MSNVQPHTRRKLWLVILIFIVLACIGIVLILTPDRQPSTKEASQSVASVSYTDTADRFMRALTRPDGAASYALMSPALKRQVGERTAWIDQVNAAYDNNRTQRFALQEISEADSNGNLRYTYTVRFRNGTAHNVIVVVADINGSILVDGYDVQR